VSSSSHTHTLPPLFYFNVTSPTEIYTLSLHDALPILARSSKITMSSKVNIRFLISSASSGCCTSNVSNIVLSVLRSTSFNTSTRSEEHTSELQSRFDLVCRLLLEKKKTKLKQYYTYSI